MSLGNYTVVYLKSFLVTKLDIWVYDLCGFNYKNINHINVMLIVLETTLQGKNSLTQFQRTFIYEFCTNFNSTSVKVAESGVEFLQKVV